MKIFIVMCCRNGEFDEPKVYDTYEQAYEAMKNEYETVLSWYPDIEEPTHSNSDFEAWLEDADHQIYWGISVINIHGSWGK